MAYIGQDLGLGQAERFIFTASGSETVVSTADDGRLIGYTVGQVSVYLNGVKLALGTDFTATNGSTITLIGNSPALSASDVIEVIALSAFSPSDTVSAASGGTFSGVVTLPSPVINTGVSGTAILDEDAMGSDSATKLATQQSIKAYVDSAATQATTAAQGVGTGDSPTFAGLTSTQNIVMSDGKGIDFSAYTDGSVAGTTTSQVLDDYEEGTWTPASTAFTISSIPYAQYTKIGKQVTIQMYIENSTGNSNDAIISGLPFSVASSHYAVGGVNMADSNATVNHLHCRALAPTATMNIKKNNDTMMVGTEIDAGHFVLTLTYST